LISSRACVTISNVSREATIMSPNATVQQRNEELARKITEETLRDPSSPFAGKFIAIAGGHVLTTANDWNELITRVEQSGVSRDDVLCLEGGVDYDEVQDIWGLR
jgi:hypothetical protein